MKQRSGLALRCRVGWRGKGIDEVGFDNSTGDPLVEVDGRYFRPTEVDALIGDATKARTKIGWKHRVTFDELVTEMVNSDRKLAGGVAI